MGSLAAASSLAAPRGRARPFPLVPRRPRAPPARRAPRRHARVRAPVLAAASRRASPELREACDAVGDELKGVSVSFVGDNESANVAVAEALARGLRYTPLSAPKLVEQVTGQSAAEILAEEGDAGLAAAEAAVLKQLSTMIRCCVATGGGGTGASARGDCWDYLFGQFTVWLDDAEAAEAAKRARPGEHAPQRDAYAFADAHLVLSAKTVDSEDDAEAIAANAMRAIAAMVEGDPQLTGKKGFYVKMGCRGDWPNIQPPGWDGTEEGKTDPSTGKTYREMKEEAEAKTKKE